MRVSEFYNLGREQDELDFVNIDISGDSRVYLDPRALRLLPTEWGQECVSLVQNFFHHVLQGIRNGNTQYAIRLLKGLSEPNETHLGMSVGRARGRGIGSHSARDLWEALSGSEAVKTGLLSDLEETLLFIPGIGTDLISDMTTNIIREPLIAYTQEICSYYGIPCKTVESGPLWNPTNGKWQNEYVQLPMAGKHKLLFVPKVIVRQKSDYDAEEYFEHYVLTYLQEEEKRAGTELVHLLQNGKLKVYKKELKEKYGKGKLTSTTLTQKYPEILENYRKFKRTHIKPPLTHEDFTEFTGSMLPDWDALLKNVLDVPLGKQGAYIYEDNIEKLLTALFYPDLSFPDKQTRIHDDRKRIDITYVNTAKQGFFEWLQRNYPAMHVFVECKNYTSDPSNPELDQIAGRFSPSRGRFGIIVCRKIENKDLFAKRCQDTAKDDRGYIIAIDDEDLGKLIVARKAQKPEQLFQELKIRFNKLIM